MREVLERERRYHRKETPLIYSQRYPKQRRQAQEQRIRTTQRQCMVLGILLLLLMGFLVVRGIHTERESVQTAGYSVEGEQNVHNETEDFLYSSQAADLLVLVNKENRLPSDYEVELHWLANGSTAVAEEMYGALRDMLTDGSEEGREFIVASGYRSSEYQQQLLDEDIQMAMQTQGLSYQEAYAQETRETMPPGYSEHETGLAADIVSASYQMLDEGQADTAENKWLLENCDRYGFILRYPKGDEEITGIDYEPWHFRYVGAEAAQEIMNRGITLEEYLQE